MGDQVVISFSFASDWLTQWRMVSGPITMQNKAKPIIVSTQLKSTLTAHGNDKFRKHSIDSLRYNSFLPAPPPPTPTPAQLSPLAQREEGGLVINQSPHN